MEALTISAHGGLEQLELRHDMPVPELRSRDDVLVRVGAAALNHLDLFVIGGLPGTASEKPWILGSDAAGVVEACGAGVTEVGPGDTVVINPGIGDGVCEYCLDGEEPLCPRFQILGEHRPGTLAEFVVVPARNVRRVPAGIALDQAASLTLATLTAWRMVVTRARVIEGEVVLIWGIGGGVAQAALRLCKARGATVWVTSGSDAKLALAAALGADETLNHRQEDVAKAIRERTGKRGVDVVIDNVGMATWKQSLAALGRRGRLVTCGATTGPYVETDVRRLFWNQWTIMGSTMGSESEFAAVVGEFVAGRMTPVVDSVHSLQDARAAFERLASGAQFGKVVIRIGR